jgi:uncharacterized repeat protein (TIGR01451 family)
MTDWFRRLARFLTAAAIVAIASLAFGMTAAQAASGQVGIVATNSPPQPSGAPSNYIVNFTCSATEVESCGDNATVNLPIDVTPVGPPTPPLSDWTFNVTSSTPGLVVSWSLVGGEIVVELDESLIDPGESLTLNLSVTPPNGYTPDGTSWEIQPTYQSSTIPEAEAPTPAIGEAEAAADIRVSKNTNDGGSIYVVGNQVIYNITASCNPGFPVGSLYLEDSRMVDTLPPDAVFVSASPAPTSAPTPPTPGGQVTWDFANPSGMPPGCVENPGGTANYQVIVEIPNTVPDETVVHNEVTMFGTPIGEDDELSTTASKDVTAVDVPPDITGEFLGKDSQGPLDIEGLGFKGTYPGHWITPTDTTPSQNPGTAEGRYTVSVNYPASRAYTTDLVDPVPCLTNQTGVKYSSLPVVGDVNGSASAPVCADPAFHPTVVRVVSASMPQAANDNWQIEYILTDGSVVTVPIATLSGTSAYFPVPGGDVGNVAAVRLPPNSFLTDRSMTMDVWGYADISTEGGEILEDIAAGSSYPVDDTDPARTSRHAAELYIEPSLLQLAVHKAFGNYGSGPGNTTALNLVGGITVPPSAQLPGPAVLTDLLPDGMEWTNPPGGGTANFTLSAGLNNIGPITGDVEYIEDYEGTGRDLIRVSFDPGDFPGSGYYRLTPPSNFILVSVPPGAREYTNTADMFASGSGRDTSADCGAAQGTDVSNFESEDPLDLDGDGVVEQNYCSFNDTLAVPGIPGPAFSLTKQVQGELDPAPKGPGGVANTTNGGTGEYTIVWRNTGTDDLTNPVEYDILPYVGDTGVSGGQANAPRGSQFQVSFDSITHLDPGISVEYSDSNNPCRPEVYPAAPDCVDDWVTTPDDPADVRSLKFVASGTYESADSFEVRFKIKLPDGEVNTIAWNSTAGTATFGNTELLPAEPPKVGITAPFEPVVPTLSTEVSSADLKPGDELTDTIEIGNADDINGTVDWTLYGPVDVGDATSCDSADWNGAPIADQGSFATSGTGSYETDPTTVTDLGCYGYEVTIDGPGYTEPVTSEVGSANEMAVSRRLQPTVSTTISSPRVTPGGSTTDRITVGQTEGRAGTIEWSLVGPVAMSADWDCEGVDWTGAAVVDQGTIATDGDGDYETPATALPDQGCYGYVVSIGGENIGGSADSPAGSPNEVVLVRTEPGKLEVTKTAARRQVQVGSPVKYTIVVRNTGAGPVPDVKLVDKPAKPMKFISAKPSQGTCDAKFPLTCELGTIEANQKATVTVMATPLVTGDVPNTATASTPDPEVDPDSDREKITGEVTLEIVKKANKPKVRAGGRIGYRIKVTNPSVATVRNVKVCDRPPAGLEVIRTAPKAKLQNGAWCWRIKRLAPHSSKLLRVWAKVLDGASGRITNVAWVEGQDVRTRRDRAAVRAVRPRPPRAGGVTG